jgi:hypothetical protein
MLGDGTRLNSRDVFPTHLWSYWNSSIRLAKEAT